MCHSVHRGSGSLYYATFCSMFLPAGSLCLVLCSFQWYVSRCLCLEFLCLGFSDQRSLCGGLCPAGLFPGGGLCPWDLCGFLSRGCLSGVSVQGVSVWGSLSRRVSVQVEDLCPEEKVSVRGLCGLLLCGLLVWPSGMTFCYGLLLWSFLMAFWCTLTLTSSFGHRSGQ